eukprot:TRINITY_DN10775_c0_g1_i1.p1 TRINITY_DN10775_c0_g1~~TRINITY_DN10775_c0_g1_i1.p1  ORF type:complete len:805 (+),score=195.65 TRINITY_DN10775_c0_g1_i1:153-2567(+)
MARHIVPGGQLPLPTALQMTPRVPPTRAEDAAVVAAPLLPHKVQETDRPSNGHSKNLLERPSNGLLNGIGHSKAPSKLRSGAYVRVEGLQARSELNGHHGMLLDFQDGTGRWNLVMEDGSGVCLKPDNIVPEPCGGVSSCSEQRLQDAASSAAVPELLREFADQQVVAFQQAMEDGNRYAMSVVSQRLASLQAQVGRRLQEEGVNVGEKFFSFTPLAIPPAGSVDLCRLSSVKTQSSLKLPKKPILQNGSGQRIEKEAHHVDFSLIPEVAVTSDFDLDISPRSHKTNGEDSDDCISISHRDSDDNMSVAERLRNEARKRPSAGLLHTAHPEFQASQIKPPKEMSNAVFADATAMKDKVRAAICKKPYSVFDFYKDTGYAQRIAKSQIFEQATLSVITLNALWIAVDTQYNDAAVLLDAHPVFMVAENLFCVYFFFEWLTRFSAFQSKFSGLRDFWFCFDSCLVFVMVLETWVMTALLLIAGGTGEGSGLGNASILKMARLLRLTRMARMARLLHAMPELMILIKAIFVAFRSVFFTVFLLMILIYIFAILFVQLTEGHPVGKQYFDGVLGAMGTLLLAGNLPDHEAFVSAVMRGNPLWGVILMAFIFLAPLTIMGMLAGVLVEVVSVVSTVEKETMVVSYVTEQLMQMLSEVDVNNDERLTKDEFQNLVIRPDAARMMSSVGVDVIGLADFCDFLFADNEEISFGTFMDMVLQLRGSNQATVKDIVDMRKFVRQELNDVLKTLSKNLVHDVERIFQGSSERMMCRLEGRQDMMNKKTQQMLKTTSKKIMAATSNGHNYGSGQDS